MPKNIFRVKGTVMRVVGGDFAYVALEKNPTGREAGLVFNRDCVELPECGWLHKQFNKLHDALTPHKFNQTLWRSVPDDRRAPAPGDRVEGDIERHQKVDTLKNVVIRGRR